ncbi:hypothetical protein MTO96_004556 [Rhipicephalus appendiculatus]
MDEETRLPTVQGFAREDLRKETHLPSEQDSALPLENDDQHLLAILLSGVCPDVDYINMDCTRMNGKSITGGSPLTCAGFCWGRAWPDAFEIHVDQHPATATKEERQRSINRYLADMLKVLKE